MEKKVATSKDEEPPGTGHSSVFRPSIKNTLKQETSTDKGTPTTDSMGRSFYTAPSELLEAFEELSVNAEKESKTETPSADYITSLAKVIEHLECVGDISGVQTKVDAKKNLAYSIPTISQDAFSKCFETFRSPTFPTDVDYKNGTSYVINTVNLISPFALIETLDSFTKFPELPNELQIKIWSHCLPAHRIVQLGRKRYYRLPDYQGFTIDFWQETSFIVKLLLHLCRLSRVAVSDRYSELAGISLGLTHITPHSVILCDFATDLLYSSSYPLTWEVLDMTHREILSRLERFALDAPPACTDNELADMTTFETRTFMKLIIRLLQLAPNLTQIILRMQDVGNYALFGAAPRDFSDLTEEVPNDWSASMMQDLKVRMIQASDEILKEINAEEPDNQIPLGTVIWKPQFLWTKYNF